jgi:hypothetical protein
MGTPGKNNKRKRVARIEMPLQNSPPHALRGIAKDKKKLMIANESICSFLYNKGDFSRFLCEFGKLMT